MKTLLESILAERQQIEEDLGKTLATLGLGAMLAAGNIAPAEASKPAYHGVAHKSYSEQDILNTIVGEASGEGYQGMLAVACAIRNREKISYYKNNILHGVYGLYAKHVKSEPPGVFVQAKKAWDESKTNDIVKGAYIWGMNKDIQKFKTQGWFKNVVPTVKIGAHTFFKNK